MQAEVTTSLITASFGVGGVVLGSALTIGAEYLRTRSAKAQQLAYTAALVSAELWKFAHECANIAYDDGVEGHDGKTYPRSDHVPDLHLDKSGVDWRVLPASLLDRVLGLPGELHEAKHLIQETRWFDDENLLPVRQRALATLGLNAVQLDEELRIVAKLGSRVREKWSPNASLERWMSDNPQPQI